MQFIDLQAQYTRYQEEIDSRMRAVLDHGRYIMVPEVNETEEILAWSTATNRSIPDSSGTQSLELATCALQIGPGDEVITIPFSWISTAEVITLVGATPVFVDIEAGAYNP